MGCVTERIEVSVFEQQRIHPGFAGWISCLAIHLKNVEGQTALKGIKEHHVTSY